MNRLLPLVALLLPVVAQAAAPSLIPVTGYLVDSDGAPVNDSVELHLKLYTSPSASTTLWTEDQTVDVDNGQFTVYLGDQDALTLDTFRDNGTVYLGVAVDTGAEMSPRFEIATAPFAAFAQYCDDAATVGGVDPLDLMQVGDTVEWAALTNVPASLLDGDADTTYTNGTGLDLSGTQFAVNQAQIDTWAKAVAYDSLAELRTELDAIYAAKQTCTDGQVLRTDSSGAWVCSDALTTLTTTVGQHTTTIGQHTSDILALQANVTTLGGNVATINATNATQSTNIAALQASTVQFTPLNASTSTRASCNAILTASESRGSGLYYIRPASTTYLAYCDMTTLSGGWTLVMNINPSDGSVASFTNTKFWMTEAEYGEIGAHFTNDYKSPAAWEVVGTNVMVAVAKPGLNGSVIGYKAWSMPVRSYDAFFDVAANTTLTTSVIGSSVANVYAYEPVIKNGTHLQANRNINPNGDRVRLGVDGYSAQGDDNQPGLGTQMNESICGAGVNCYRYRDVELWVNSGGNLWCSRPVNGSYGWIGLDGGCGDSCDDCEQNKGGAYAETWTYRMFVR
jgi:hypothetical protein